MESLLKTKSSSDVKLVVTIGDGTTRPDISLEGLSRGSILTGFENGLMGIYDIALLAECEQLIDVDTRTRHDVEVIVEDFGNTRLPDLSDYKQMNSAIINIVEEGYQREDIEDDWDEEREFDQPDKEND